MRIMAVDYGDARTGLAVCDKFEMLASPLCVINQVNQKLLIREIVEISKKEGVELIVVGYPKNMDSSIGARAEKCNKLADSLELAAGIKVELWDERLTTVSAHQAMNDNNIRGEKRKKIIDAVAATIILQDYMAFRKKSANK